MLTNTPPSTHLPPGITRADLDGAALECALDAAAQYAEHGTGAKATRTLGSLFIRVTITDMQPRSLPGQRGRCRHE